MSTNDKMVAVPHDRTLLLVNLLAAVSGAAFRLADNSEDDGSEGINCQRLDFEALSDALDKCDELPELPGEYVRDGWLRAADELRAILAKPAEQHQGEPVAWLARAVDADGTTYRQCVSTNELTERDAKFAWGEGVMNRCSVVITPLGPLADPGEAERCEARLREVASLCASVEQERDALRAQLAALRELKLPHYLKLSDEMRAAGDHAEQRALEDQCYSVPVLKAVFFEAAIQRWLDDQEEALETRACEHDWVDGRNEIIKSGEFCRKCLAVRAGNETSEPSATKSKPRAHDVMMFQRAPTPPTINGHKLNCKAVDDYKPGECSCGAEPSAPVEHVNVVTLGITGLAEPSATVCSPAVLSQQIDELERIPLSWPDQFRGQLLVVLKLMAGQESKP